MSKQQKQRDTRQKIILLICNILLIAISLIGAVLYSRHVYKTQEETKKADFIRTIESMKQVSRNYLDSERGYVKDWAAYISEHEMTLEEAMVFLRSVNTNSSRFVHIVDMDTYEAYSSYYPAGEEKIDTYISYLEKNAEDDLPFQAIMENMYAGTDDRFEILGKYRLQETKGMGVGVGTRVTLLTDQGTRDYLMLRVIPTDVIKKWWVFPTEYSSAEVGIITRSGDYVIQSPSMKSQNFREYIRGYNFQDDYNQVNALRQQLETTESGILTYKNYRGADCLWYYSCFDENSALDILGVLNMDDLKASVDAWYIILLVCGTLIVLVLLDGAYLVSMNRRLRETARISEQASHAKTRFLSAMSHDIRTPLNAVMGMMTLAQKKSGDSVYVEDCMEKGLQSGHQLLTLINDVLDISRSESGKTTLNPEPVDLIEMMQELTGMLEQSLEEKQITLTCDLNRLPARMICADRMRLNQIYMNLITNAVKYTEKGGRVLLSLYEEPIADSPGEVLLVFYVKDTGIGMTEEFQKRMYSTFSREVNTQVNSIQGTGLGLSIVKQMVDLMGGTIYCDSAPGEGTSFTVRLRFPVVKERKEQMTREAEVRNPGSMHLLVVEDNELNWQIFKELALEEGITCDHAENGRVCLEMLEKALPDTYDAVLMDVNMPVMNGYEATRAIRQMADEKLRGIPIIAMTADAFAEDVQACLDSGMNGHIAKPIDMEKLNTYLLKIRNGQMKDRGGHKE